MPGTIDWVLLAYRVPREPSTPRIAIWRRLRALGVAQINDGLVALPYDARTREQLEWIAQAIDEAGGESTLWIARLSSAAQERLVAQRMTELVASAYRAVIDDAAEAEHLDAGARRRSLSRLRRELRRIGRRDFFPPPERDRARAAVDALARLVEAPA